MTNEKHGRRSSGILGGAYDPVHNGHLSIAQQVLARSGLDRVLLVPAALPPHKDQTAMAPGADRLQMVRLAVSGLRGLEASDIEFRRAGPSYSIDTVRALMEHWPDDRFVFIIGADTVPELPAWHQARLLIELVDWAVVPRPGCGLDDLSMIESSLGSAAADKLRRAVVRVEAVDLSSTEVRRRLQAGQPIGRMVRSAVVDYIRARGLYAS